MRTAIGLLIAAALLLGVVFFWFAAPDDTNSSTEAAPTTSSTTSTSTSTSEDSTTSTTIGATTSTSTGSHVVETEAEAEEILRELWFGWFEGIYNQDEDRIREVVVLEETVEVAAEQFGSMEFSTAPMRKGIEILDLEILRSDEDCLATWATLDVSAFRLDAVGSEGVYVLRRDNSSWALLSVWQQRGDLWEPDCESLLQ